MAGHLKLPISAAGDNELSYYRARVDILQEELQKERHLKSESEQVCRRFENLSKELETRLSMKEAAFKILTNQVADKESRASESEASCIELKLNLKQAMRDLETAMNSIFDLKNQLENERSLRKESFSPENMADAVGELAGKRY